MIGFSLLKADTGVEFCFEKNVSYDKVTSFLTGSEEAKKWNIRTALPKKRWHAF